MCTRDNNTLRARGGTTVATTPASVKMPCRVFTDVTIGNLKLSLKLVSLKCLRTLTTSDEAR